MRLVWSPFALADRDEIFSYIEADNPKAAAEIDERIASAMHRLGFRKAAGPAGSRAPANWSFRALPISPSIR